MTSCLRNILSFLALTGAIVSGISTGFAATASDFPFSDVKTADALYVPLKSLYERGVVGIPSDGKFHPEALMNRDEFVAIVVWVGCKKCLTPSLDDIMRYTTAPFIDFPKSNPYFYCVSYAKEKGLVEWYANIVAWVKPSCENGNTYDSAPFCAENRISRIEAAAVLLRQAGLWNQTLNSSEFARTMTIPDVDAYWFWYAQKAVSAGLIVQDASGKVRPDERITKREFVLMAEKIFSMNLCQIRDTDADTKDISSEIKVVDKASTCSAVSPATKFPKLSESAYSFIGITSASGATYEWQFVNQVTKESKTFSGQNACNFDLGSAGDWIVRLTVKDPSGKTSTSYAEVPVVKDASSIGIGVWIQANPISTLKGFDVVFSSQVSGGSGNLTYRWDFGDGSYSSEQNPIHAYDTSGTYPVTLVVTDSDWNRWFARLVEQVTETLDSDGDGILDNEDSCPLVFGTKQSKGCPVVTPYTPPSVTTTDRIDRLSWLSPDLIGNQCLANLAIKKGALYGEASCSACPCAYTAEFNASIRRCDILFPAILSPNKKTFYSRGAVYELGGNW